MNSIELVNWACSDVEGEESVIIVSNDVQFCLPSTKSKLPFHFYYFKPGSEMFYLGGAQVSRLVLLNNINDEELAFLKSRLRVQSDIRTEWDIAEFIDYRYPGIDHVGFMYTKTTFKKIPTGGPYGKQA